MTRPSLRNSNSDSAAGMQERIRGSWGEGGHRFATLFMGAYAVAVSTVARNAMREGRGRLQETARVDISVPQCPRPLSPHTIGSARIGSEKGLGRLEMISAMVQQHARTTPLRPLLSRSRAGVRPSCPPRVCRTGIRLRSTRCRMVWIPDDGSQSAVRVTIIPWSMSIFLRGTW